MDIFLSILAIVLMLVGLAGAILPIVPGPVISYLGLLSIYFLSDDPLSDAFMISLAIITVVVSAIDQIVPVLGTKKLGGSRYGINGSILGLIVGIFFFPPIGLILGPFLGALIGEMIGGKDLNQATRAGFGSFLGFLTGTVLKLTFSGVVAYYILINLSFSIN
jgi:uncharacterized protein YqgC (DUF456 family)